MTKTKTKPKNTFPQFNYVWLFMLPSNPGIFSVAFLVFESWSKVPVIAHLIMALQKIQNLVLRRINDTCYSLGKIVLC